MPASSVARDDYDEYVNGEWKNSNSIPDDQVRWGSFSILSEDNRRRLREICETDTGLVGQLYAKAMSVPTSISPAALELLTLARGIESPSDYLRLSGKLLTQAIPVCLHMCKSSDDKEPSKQPPHIMQAGLGLPDMSYYTPVRPELHEPYRAYISDICKLYGHEVDPVAVFDLESRLAKLHLTRVECRDSQLTYNRREWNEVHPLLPEFFDALGLPEMKHAIVQNPRLLENLNQTINDSPISALRDHLVFKIASSLAGRQTQEFVDRNFAFYGKLLNGQQKMDDLWKRALATVTFYLGDELGKLYVAKHFTEAQRAVCLDMIDKLIVALRTTLSELDWMSAETKAVAQQKIDMFEVKIGHPTKYHSIEGLWSAGLPSDLTQTYLQWAQWDWTTQECALFYSDVDRELWHMRPQEVNAYYHPNMNEIVFPAGILQLPFFGYDTVEENLGAIGTVIGHEMTHGYDDEGRKYNPRGELQEWWSEADSAEFDKRAKVVEEHFSSLSFMGKPVNGKLTLGENIADIGGLKLALRALRLHYGGDVDGMTYDKFFRAYAAIEKMLSREEFAHRALVTDPHAPAKLRINAALAHVPEFYLTYDIREGDGMYLPPAQRMTIW